MEHWDSDGPTRRYGFYMVGFLKILDAEGVLRDVQVEPSGNRMERFRNNAHIRRGLTDPKHWDRFWAFRGSEQSRRFPYAVPVTRELCQEAFRAADGSPWRWDGQHRSELQVIGSYTRSCRCVIDPSSSDGAVRSDAFWEWIDKYDQRQKRTSC